MERNPMYALIFCQRYALNAVSATQLVCFKLLVKSGNNGYNCRSTEITG